MSSHLQDSGDKENHEELLKLSLSTGSPMGQTYPSTTLASRPTQILQTVFQITPFSSLASDDHQYTTPFPQEITAGSFGTAEASSVSSRPPRTRKSTVQKLKPQKIETIPARHPWATNRRATIHSLQYLLSRNMNKITGEVQCKRCEQVFEIEYDLKEKFLEVASFILENKHAMHDRAPAIWVNPNLPNCKLCGQRNCAKPILSKKKSINWLFLLLGQMLGCCKLSELKYYCKHTKNHRTGAKDRVLYLTYLGLCKQLDPEGSFDA